MQTNRPIRVLVAEDDEISRLALKYSLEDVGFEVCTVGSVEETVKVAKEFNPQILLTDIGLPDGSGTSLLMMLKRSQEVRSIAITGYDSDEAIKSYKAAGFDKWVFKPINLDQVNKLILELVEQN